MRQRRRPTRRKGRWQWGVALLFLAVYLAGWGFIVYTMSDGYRTYRELEARATKLTQEKRQLEERLDQVQKAAGMRRADSPFFVEMVAREKLKMARKGEVIIRLTGDNGVDDGDKTPR